jgi:polyhydroxyalkanoate synthesis regulator phasin
MGRYVTIRDLIRGTAGEGAHPICVIKKLAAEKILDKVVKYAELSEEEKKTVKDKVVEAAKKCKEEKKYHGIYKLIRTAAGLPL